MNIKFYIGDNEVTPEEYQEIKTTELAAGNGIKASREADGLPQYTLENGTIIRGDGQGGFYRYEDGEKKEEWVPGTENEWIQQEPTDIGKADFFCLKK